MSIENIILIAAPAALLGLIIWYSARSEQQSPETETDSEDELLFDPLTGKHITVEEAEQGMDISEEEEEALLKDVEFEDVEIEKTSEDSTEEDQKSK